MANLALFSSNLLSSWNPNNKLLYRRCSLHPAAAVSIGRMRRRRRPSCFAPRTGISCDGVSNRLLLQNVLETLEMQNFASILSSTNSHTPQYSTPPLRFGSPILWIGVGIGISALFSVVATKLKRKAILEAFKTLSGQMEPQDGQLFNSSFSLGSPFPFPSASPLASTATSSTPLAYQRVVNVDVSEPHVEAAAPTEVQDLNKNGI